MLTQNLFAALRAGTDFQAALAARPKATDEDAALALWVLHELHYRGLADVDDGLEWDADLLRLRGLLEADLEARLRSRHRATDGLSFVTDALDWIDDHDGPSLARHVHRHADRDQVLDLLRVRSIYHLKESDPVSWLVPRLGVRAKAALMELQYDEYGNGDPNRLHHHLFAEGMAASGLEPAYDAHLDVVPIEALEQNNALTLFGLHRRLRGAIVGHLALFEMTSSVPNRRYGSGLRRLGYGQDAIEFFDVHVVADAVHESVAAVDLAGGLAKQDVRLGADVLWGARALLEIDGDGARHMMSAWEDDGSSLRPTLALR
jgi:hypothetical protein